MRTRKWIPPTRAFGWARIHATSKHIIPPEKLATCVYKTVGTRKMIYKMKISQKMQNVVAILAKNIILSITPVPNSGSTRIPNNIVAITIGINCCNRFFWVFQFFNPFALPAYLKNRRVIKPRRQINPWTNMHQYNARKMSWILARLSKSFLRTWKLTSKMDHLRLQV